MALPYDCIGTDVRGSLLNKITGTLFAFILSITVLEYALSTIFNNIKSVPSSNTFAISSF